MITTGGGEGNFQSPLVTNIGSKRRSHIPIQFQNGGIFIMLRTITIALTFAFFLVGGVAAPWTVSVQDGVSVDHKTADAKKKDKEKKD